MPHPVKTKSTVTITINPVKWKTFQVLSKEKLNLKASPHVELLIDKAIADMQGKEVNITVNLSELQRQRLALVKNADELLKVLEAHGVREALEALLESYGLNFDTYAIASEVIGKLLTLKGTSLKGAPYTRGDIDLCIDLIEIKAKICEVRAKIDSIRAKQYLHKDDKTNANKGDQNKDKDDREASS